MAASDLSSSAPMPAPASSRPLNPPGTPPGTTPAGGPATDPAQAGDTPSPAEVAIALGMEKSESPAPAGPVDADWPAHDPSTPSTDSDSDVANVWSPALDEDLAPDDAGVLESIGRAITAPVRDTAPEDPDDPANPHRARGLA